MKRFITFCKGLILGFVGLAVPGLSASTIALEINVYYDLIDSISNIFKKFKKSALFLIFLMMGYFAGGFIGSVAMNTVYVTTPIIMILLVMGMVIGGIPNMAKDLKSGIKKPSCWIVMVLLSCLLIAFSFFLTAGKEITFDDMIIADYIVLFFVGVFTSATLVVPGVDFAVLLISLGYYSAFTSLVANFFDFSVFLHTITVLGIYLIGYGIGSFILSKLIKIIINKYEDQTKYASFAFVLVAPAIIIRKGIFDNPNFSYTTGELVMGIILGVVSMVSMILLLHYISKRKKNKELGNINSSVATIESSDSTEAESNLEKLESDNSTEIEKETIEIKNKNDNMEKGEVKECLD